MRRMNEAHLGARGANTLLIENDAFRPCRRIKEQGVKHMIARRDYFRGHEGVGSRDKNYKFPEIRHMVILQARSS